MFRNFLSVSGRQVGLQSRTRRAVFLFTVTAIAATTAVLTVRVGVADFLSDSSDLSLVQWALRLDPENASIHHWAGVLYNEEQGQPQEALRQFRQALSLNPYKARYWADLGWACVGQNDAKCTETSFRNALMFAPSAPRFWWDAFNFSVLMGSKQEAAERLRHYLEISDANPKSAFELYIRAFNDPENLWKLVSSLPAAHATQIKYLEILVENGEVDRSIEYWRQLVSRRALVTFKTAEPYLRALVAAGQYTDAIQVWLGLQTIGAVRRSDPDNLIFNGKFDHQPVNVAFDWQVNKSPYVFVDFSDRDHVKGTQGLCIDYTVPDNSDSEAVGQFVPVHGNQSYVLSAQVRSENITSDSGPRLRVVDVQCPSCLTKTTDGTVGTTPWHEVTVGFTTQPQTELVAVSVWRPHSRSFPNAISGHFWVNSVVLSQTTISSSADSASLAHR